MGEYLPLFVDFSGRKVVIFGGGAVGERKATYFAGADVTVVSRDFTPGLEARPGVKLVRRTVRAQDIPGLVADAFLVVAAMGDPGLDDEIARAAGRAGALVNSAEGGSSVILPSVLRRGDITVAIATGGRSPAMSKYLRQRLEASLGEELAAMVWLQAELRERLKKTVPSQRERERLLWVTLNDPSTWEALRRSYEEGLAIALQKLEGTKVEKDTKGAPQEEAQRHMDDED